MRLETLNLSDEDMGEQEGGSGRVTVNRAQSPAIQDWTSISELLSGSSSLGLIVGQKEARRAGRLGLANGSLGLNMRGPNNSSKRKIIKAFISNQRVDLLCIQETKIQSMSEGIVRSLGSGRFLDWKVMNTEGALGGILICWDKRSLDILDWEEGHFTLSCRFRNVENGAVWVFTGVYGPFSKVEKE